jgi:hypothetical protein
VDFTGLLLANKRNGVLTDMQACCYYEIFVPIILPGNGQVLIFRKQAVLVAPKPLLARLGRDDERMEGLVIMFGHMFIGRVVAA